MTYTTPIPGAGVYGQAVDTANLAYKNALGRLNQQRSGALRQFGYAGDIDPETGTLTNTHVDGGNQFGAFQEMLRSGAESANSVRDQLIERHLGSGGLAAQSEGQLKQDFGRNSSALGQQLLDTLGGFQDTQNQAAYTRDQALYQAQLDSTRGAISNGDFSPADPTNPDPGAGPAGDAAPPNPYIGPKGYVGGTADVNADAPASRRLNPFMPKTPAKAKTQAPTKKAKKTTKILTKGRVVS